jgi:hypothetical protein
MIQHSPDKASILTCPRGFQDRIQLVGDRRDTDGEPDDPTPHPRHFPALAAKAGSILIVGDADFFYGSCTASGEAPKRGTINASSCFALPTQGPGGDSAAEPDPTAQRPDLAVPRQRHSCQRSSL